MYPISAPWTFAALGAIAEPRPDSSIVIVKTKLARLSLSSFTRGARAFRNGKRGRTGRLGHEAQEQPSTGGVLEPLAPGPLGSGSDRHRSARYQAYVALGLHPRC